MWCYKTSFVASFVALLVFSLFLGCQLFYFFGDKLKYNCFCMIYVAHLAKFCSKQGTEAITKRTAASIITCVETHFGGFCTSAQYVLSQALQPNKEVFPGIFTTTMLYSSSTVLHFHPDHCATTKKHVWYYCI